MGLAQYNIVAQGDEWSVLHDENVKNRYATKESAFGVAVAAASLAIHEGHEVHISVPDRSAGNQTALGARAVWVEPAAGRDRVRCQISRGQVRHPFFKGIEGTYDAAAGHR